MSDTTYNVFQHYGTNAERLAFVPDPAGTIQPIYVWYETDTDEVFIYTTAWNGPFAASGSGSPGAHAPSHNTGGGDPITALDGGVITTGTVADARLSSNVPLKDTINIFTSRQVISEPIHAQLTLVAATAAADDRAFDIGTLGSELVFRAVTDAIVTEGDPVSIDRLGVLRAPAGLVDTPLDASDLTTGVVPIAAIPAHATTHQDVGSDELDVKLLGGYPGGTTDFLRADATFATVSTAARTGLIGMTVDAGSSVISTGLKGYIEIPFACTIQTWTLLADVSGSIVMDIWKDTYANYPPVVGDSITASAKPTITTAVKNQSSTLTGWTTSVSAGDILAFNVDSVTTIKKITLSLKVQAV